ncbi:uncharacterized protein LOC131634151 [Vicia villosa]|uniref:uncharacterized protein LOC131634151 n=1 Tax=Vicia villosa TaxID=3911 RepID=UPI00273CB79A|nr:uncharacterized protein LOC131634151 [Vicia villosa]
MIIYSLNVRGGGKFVKRKRVGFNIQRDLVDIAFIQETKLRDLQYHYVKEMWDDDMVEWSHLDADGASGGILIMWRKDFFKLIYNFRGGGFLEICVERENRRIYFVNIYASCDHKVRLKSWRRLVELKRRSNAGSWCIGGDFNLITSLDERVGERDVSDHAPIWIKYNKRNWGPKTFRFNNLWFNHNYFSAFVEEEWKKIVVKGRGDYCLVEKLKALKGKIVKWNKEIYGWIDLNIEEAEKEMHFFDNKFAHFAGNVSEEVVAKRSRAAIDFWDNLYKKEGFLHKKSRQLWLAEGDCNTRYFHNSLKERRSRNSLCSLESSSGRVEDVSEVKEFIFNHFNCFFKEDMEGRPNLSGLDMKMLHGFESLNIERSFIELEIKEAI